MPIFLKYKLLYIHIPKCGGTSIARYLETLGDEISFFTSTGAVFLNGHVPQHCTYRELKELNFISDHLSIFTVIRDPFARTLSEYFYLLTHRPDITKYFTTFDEFLTLFLNKQNTLLFDYHNLSCFDFLTDGNNQISDRITIFKYFEANKIEEFIGVRANNISLNDFRIFQTDKNGFELNPSQKELIKEYFADDFQYFKFAI